MKRERHAYPDVTFLPTPDVGPMYPFARSLVGQEQTEMFRGPSSAEGPKVDVMGECWKAQEALATAQNIAEEKRRVSMVRLFFCIFRGSVLELSQYVTGLDGWGCYFFLLFLRFSEQVEFLFLFFNREGKMVWFVQI